ncbi:DUF1214 domain-containing protein [Vibrio splendidus]|uniref:DUF1214 domain-containing protein n=1 Tax=Vibrio splendidus TaxID=29497 RepID=UPI0011B841AB|nr:DUF1254 domain-containing protein [Vibrio splendidus]
MKLTFIASVLSLSVTTAFAGDNNDLTFTSSHGYQFVNNVPSAETSQKMYQDQNIQYAAMVYQWSMPAMGLKGWENANHDMGNSANSAQISSYQGDGARGILTPNQVVEYLIAFHNADVHGPVVWEVPAGMTAGYVGDQWQRPIIDVGVAGPEQGKGVKLLILGPGQQEPEHDGSYTVVESPTNVIWLGTRNMERDPIKHKQITESFKAYPFNQQELRDRPIVSKQGDAFIQAQPRGMTFWENLNEIVQREVMHERDVFFYAMLKDLGIEKGKLFNPTKEQKAILIAGEELGYLQAINNTYKKNFEGANYFGDKNWFVALVNDSTQQQETHGELRERAAWFHEAIGSTKAMKMYKPGPGQMYLGAYEDANGIGFDGSNNYHLNVPADVPADLFWAVTIYDSKYRNLIANSTGQAEINSSNKLTYNEDGSVDVFIGPQCEKSKGCVSSNWVQTEPGQTWFTYFRLYTPNERYFSGDWSLDNIQLVQ